MAPEPGDCICPVRASGTFPASFDSTAAFFRSLTYLHYGYGIVLPALVSGPSRIRSHRNVRVPQVANYGRSDFTADSVGGARQMIELKHLYVDEAIRARAGTNLRYMVLFYLVIAISAVFVVIGT